MARLELQETAGGYRLWVLLSDGDVARLNREYDVTITKDDDGFIPALSVDAGLSEVRLVVEVK